MLPFPPVCTFDLMKYIGFFNLMIFTELLDQFHTNVTMCMQLRSELLSLPFM